MTTHCYQSEIAVALAAAKEAARIILDVLKAGFLVDFKEGREPVTVADRRSNELVCNCIADAFPHDGIVAEESAPSDTEALAQILKNERVWFIDPLDGTKEFVAGNNEFAVMIGLAVGGVAVLGVVAQPVQARTWVGVVGDRAWCIAESGVEEPCSVSSVDELAHATLIVSRSHRPESLRRAIEKLGVARHVACGSVGVKASRVASGAADLYVCPPQRRGAKFWDSCAPEALAKASGGRVTNCLGQDMDYSRCPIGLTEGLVISNGLLHEAAIGAIAAAGTG